MKKITAIYWSFHPIRYNRVIKTKCRNRYWTNTHFVIFTLESPTDITATNTESTDIQTAWVMFRPVNNTAPTVLLETELQTHFPGWFSLAAAPLWKAAHWPFRLHQWFFTHRIAHAETMDYEACCLLYKKTDNFTFQNTFSGSSRLSSLWDVVSESIEQHKDEARLRLLYRP